MALLRLLGCSAGIYVCYITYGILQEGVYKYTSPVTGERFSSTLTLLLIQAVLNYICATTICWWQGMKPLPATAFALPGCTFIAAMLCSNEALKYVSYPTQVLAKSCKLVPVLLVNVLVYSRTATFLQYVHVALVTAGIVLFRLKNTDAAQEHNSLYGIGLLLLSLLLDGVTGPTQQHLKERYSPSPFQLMRYCNLWGSLLIIALLVASGEFLSGVMFLLQPEHAPLLSRVVLFSLAGAAGQAFIYTTLLEFGALTLTTVTTTRKFFTILFSVVLYGHVLSAVQWAGVALVFVGLSLDVVEKKRNRDTMSGMDKVRPTAPASATGGDGGDGGDGGGANGSKAASASPSPASNASGKEKAM
ncbi:hypothetical protein PTSG_06967 [Salpingoeca rosetta]|uniref:Solute carrier family 35 member B1 n=1 Tax=Salpingoeca rosetta (strain ATCC 50818 / BSB-021) TaxID=946362 RepID=F2UFB7_SALR5|nr:uncharacterized protein PTSG_06967 [Salpingoeca rosetta]EGD75317.1 hypothetical protein PTSG_06967 [Salpingoeca rosetta]|eukprot:XP_004992370.1 hypothetical protein PTSG_06967 [Salpingoeca rosetta]